MLVVPLVIVGDPIGVRVRHSGVVRVSVKGRLMHFPIKSSHKTELQTCASLFFYTSSLSLSFHNRNDDFPCSSLTEMMLAANTTEDQICCQIPTTISKSDCGLTAKNNTAVGAVAICVTFGDKSPCVRVILIHGRALLWRKNPRLTRFC